MKVIEKYIAREVIGAVAFVLVAFLALFAFFDLIGELKEIGRGAYRLQHAFLYIGLRLPAYTYDLLPIAALIGTIYALSQLAARSEFTIMRASSMSTGMAGGMLARVGLLFVVLTFLVGEFLAPVTSDMAERLKLRVQGSSLSQQFRSGLWAKDTIRKEGLSGPAVGTRFVNVGQVQPDGQLRQVRLFEFDSDMRLVAVVTADHADYAGRNVWRMTQVTEALYTGNAFDNSAAIARKHYPTRNLVSEITPDILSVLFADPDRMSARDLEAYTRHLKENSQNTERYEISFWKKVFYPFAVLVMMALALPFAYLHFRSGGVSLKIFVGIMIGVSFQLLNSLFSHIGLLNTWPALTTALLPSVLFLLIALIMLWWVERH